jgi:hypothetical protein
MAEPSSPPPPHSPQPWYRLGWVTWLALFIVGAAFVGSNLMRPVPRIIFQDWLARGISARVRYDVTAERWGWPFTYRVRYQTSETARDGTIYSRPLWQQPTLSLRNPRTWALIGNVVLTLVVLGGTVVFVQYWLRHRKGPFQFGLKTLFLLTALVAVLLTFLVQRTIRWDSLLFLPIGFGFLCTAGSLGLVFKACFRAEDARLSRLRRRFSARERSLTGLDSENGDRR